MIIKGRFKVISIIKKTKALGWKELKVGDEFEVSLSIQHIILEFNIVTPYSKFTNRFSILYRIMNDNLIVEKID